MKQRENKLYSHYEFNISQDIIAAFPMQPLLSCCSSHSQEWLSFLQFTYCQVAPSSPCTDRGILHFPSGLSYLHYSKAAQKFVLSYSINKKNHYQTTCLEVYIYLCLVKLRVKLNSAEQITSCLGTACVLYFLLKHSFLTTVMMTAQFLLSGNIFISPVTSKTVNIYYQEQKFCGIEKKSSKYALYLYFRYL